MKLIVGLGNTGKEYENTRHNVGFMALDRIATFLNIDFQKEKFQGIYAEGYYEGEKYILLKPQKYMNLSGEVIKDYVQFFKIPISDILIIYDDLDTSVGTYRLRYQGSSGGHNGIKNIEQHLQTKEYKRIKFGISNNKKLDTKDYVLGNFSGEEKEIMNKTLDKIVDIFKDYPKMTFENLMNKYNGK